jgi:hypothetical protein
VRRGTSSGYVYPGFTFNHGFGIFYTVRAAQTQMSSYKDRIRLIIE